MISWHKRKPKVQQSQACVCPLASSPSGHSAQPPVIPPGFISGMSQSIQGKAPANGVPTEEMGAISAVLNYKKIAFPDFYIF